MGPAPDQEAPGGEGHPGAAPGSAARILFLVDELEVGGTQRQILILGKRFLSLGHRVAVAYFRDRSSALRPQLEASGFEVLLIPKRSRLDPVFLLRLVGLLRRERSSLTISFGFTANLWTRIAGILALSSRPVSCVRDLSYLPELPGRGLLRPLEWLLSWQSRWVVSNSSVTALSLVQRRCVPGRKVLTIPNAIETGPFPSREVARARIERLLARPMEGPVIGTFARLVAVKDLGTLVRAAEEVVALRPEAVFVIGGEGPERGKLEALRAELGLERCVLLPGSLATHELLTALDAAVLTSFSEGMPNFILEAMAAGVPVVSTRAGAVPELLEHGALGLLVPQGDPREVAHAILEVLERPGEARTRALSAQEKVKEMSSDRMARRYLSLFLCSG